MKAKWNWLIPLFGLLAFAALMAAVESKAQTGQGQAIVTVLPKHDNAAQQSLDKPDISVKIDGKVAHVDSWRAMNADSDRIELVLLLDSGSRSSLGTQFEDITKFLTHLPPNTVATIAYMANGSAYVGGGFTSDHELLGKMLHLPGGAAGSNASPYFCISDLAKKWPSDVKNARRIVVMVSDGVDLYNGGNLPTDDPYLNAATKDAAARGIVVYSIYWKGKGAFDNTQGADNYGQTQLAEITQATGGRNFWIGNGNPVGFENYFDELTRILRNQYELRFSVPLKKGAELETMKLKLSAPGNEVNAPEQVYVYPSPVSGLK